MHIFPNPVTIICDPAWENRAYVHKIAIPVHIKLNIFIILQAICNLQDCASCIRFCRNDCISG